MASYVTVTFADDSEKTFRLTNRERVGYDLARSRENWPPAQEAPFMALTYQAFLAARKAGYEKTWTEFFENDHVDIAVTTAEGKPITALESDEAPKA